MIAIIIIILLIITTIIIIAILNKSNIFENKLGFCKFLMIYFLIIINFLNRSSLWLVSKNEAYPRLLLDSFKDVT